MFISSMSIWYVNILENTMELFRLENVPFGYVLFICSSNVHIYFIEIYDQQNEFGQECRKFKKGSSTSLVACR